MHEDVASGTPESEKYTNCTVFGLHVVTIIQLLAFQMYLKGNYAEGTILHPHPLTHTHTHTHAHAHTCMYIHTLTTPPSSIVKPYGIVSSTTYTVHLYVYTLKCIKIIQCAYIHHNTL